MMNVRALTKIDRWVGVPMCFLLTWWKHLTGWTNPADGVKPEAILFIKLAEQGSTVLAHLALQKAVARVGRDHVFMVVFEDNRFIVDVLGLIPAENVLTVSTDGVLPLLREAMHALLRLRRITKLAAIDLEFFARASAAFSYLSGAAVRVGFHAYFGEGPYRGKLMSHRVRYNPNLHTSQTFASLVDALDIAPRDFPRFDRPPPAIEHPIPSFEPLPGEIEAVEKLLALHSKNAGARPLILLNANASDLIPLRRWDENRYVELAQRLIARFGKINIAFTGAPEESVKIDALVRRIADDRVFSMAGKTTLRQLMVLYGLADVLVTNDSGPAHFASLTQIHTVTLFGPETPLLFAAVTPRNTPLTAGLPCSPCVSALNNRQSACRDNACMQRIAVDEVFEAVCRSLAARGISEKIAPTPASQDLVAS